MDRILSILPESDNSAASASQERGYRGEAQAAQFLEAKGYRIVLTNFKVPVGRNSKGVAVTGEIDIVALDGDVLCFVEVKTRAFDPFAYPLTAVDLRKQRQITRTSRVYRRIFGIRGMRVRFDVVSIILGRGDARSDISLAKGYWTEERFRMKSRDPRF